MIPSKGRCFFVQITFITNGTEAERQARIDKAYTRLIKQFKEDYLKEISEKDQLLKSSNKQKYNTVIDPGRN
jgi:hypothetical protein